MYKVIELKFACNKFDADWYMARFVDDNPDAQSIPYILKANIRKPTKSEIKAMKDIDRQR